MLNENQIPEPDTFQIEVSYQEMELIKKVLRVYDYLLDNPKSKLSTENVDIEQQKNDINLILKRKWSRV